jgi:hypothetical protein
MVDWVVQKSVRSEHQTNYPKKTADVECTALSELGRRAYIHFWAGTIARYIASHPAKKTITVKNISDDTFVLPEDIIIALKDMQVLDHRKRGEANAVINKAKIRSWAATNRVSMAGPVDQSAFIERPGDSMDE